MANLLLHSLKEFDEVIFEIAERLELFGVLEIGSETGVFSERLHGCCAKRKVKLLTIDPSPAKALVELAKKSETLDLVVGYSIPHLEEFGTDANLVLIDGDHNYYTVFNELRLIQAAWRASDRSGVILLHDVGFPTADRDSYYDPETIPEGSRHPNSFEQGVTLGSNALIQGGFRGEGVFAWALKAGGPKNGVLTAVKDFVAQHPEYSYRSLDAVFGLGALTRTGSAADTIVGEVFARYDNALIRRLEQNRLELYLKVIELQDLLTARGT
jgi:hypothetical protein